MKFYQITIFSCLRLVLSAFTRIHFFGNKYISRPKQCYLFLKKNEYKILSAEFISTIISFLLRYRHPPNKPHPGDGTNENSFFKIKPLNIVIITT